MQGRKKEFFALLKKFFLTPKIRAWHKGLFPMNTIVNMSFYIQKSLLINTKAITIDSLNFIESTKCVDESKRPQICVGSSKSSKPSLERKTFFWNFWKSNGKNFEFSEAVFIIRFPRPEALENVPGPSTKILGNFKIFTIRFIAWKIWKFWTKNGDKNHP